MIVLSNVGQMVGLSESSRILLLNSIFTLICSLIWLRVLFFIIFYAVVADEDMDIPGDALPLGSSINSFHRGQEPRAQLIKYSYRIVL